MKLTRHDKYPIMSRIFMRRYMKNVDLNPVKIKMNVLLPAGLIREATAGYCASAELGGLPEPASVEIQRGLLTAIQTMDSFSQRATRRLQLAARTLSLSLSQRRSFRSALGRDLECRGTCSRRTAPPRIDSHLICSAPLRKSFGACGSCYFFYTALIL